MKLPIVDAIRTYPKKSCWSWARRFAENGFFYIFTVFVLTYATQIAKLPRQDRAERAS